MPSFRETIEAVLKAKDSARFKAAMEVSAKAIEHFAKAEEEAEIQSEILEQIQQELEHQTVELTAAIVGLSHEVNALGHDMLELAADMETANVVMKQSGSNAVFLGKSWAWWKDRMSLTRSEIYTTGLTIGAYLSPALIALGSSFVEATIGGAAVGAGGMASFLLGLGAIVTIAAPVVGGIKKIKKAQDQLNQTIDQYGAASIQASRANAHLYAVIQNNGGAPAANALANIESLTTAWKKLTAPGQSDLLDVLNQGLGTAQNMAPFAAGLANGIAHSLRSALLDALKTIQGPDIKNALSTLADIFESSIGPGIRGSMNLLVIFSRVIVATAPWVKRLASSYEQLTDQWKDRATQTRVTKFINGAVNQFRSWWALAKAVGRGIGIIWTSTKSHGQDAVNVLTNIVNKFDDWLQKMKDTGAIDRFYRKYYNTISDLVTAAQHPIQALDQAMPGIISTINKYLPQLMDAIADNLGQNGPKAAGIFLKAFVQADAWAKFLTIGYFAVRFGFFGKLGAWAGGIFVTPFIERFGAAFVASLGASGALGVSIQTAMASAGTSAGTAFGGGLASAGGAIAAAAGSAIGSALGVAIAAAAGTAFVAHFFPAGGPGTKLQNFSPGSIWDWMKKNSPIVGGSGGSSFGDILKGIFGRHKAAGGLLFPGQTAVVGERGPEVARVGPGGAEITPMDRAQAAIPHGIVDIPDISSAIRLITNVSVQVDKREIARANAESRAYDKARRGQD